MKISFIQIVCFLLLPAMAIAQRDRSYNSNNRYGHNGSRYNNNNSYGDLTVFSPDQEPFFLVINGERMNNAPQTFVKVEGLPYDIYRLEIEFDDVYIPILREDIEISRRGLGSGSIYKIGWKWNNKPVLLPASYAPTSGRCIVQYGNNQNYDNNRYPSKNRPMTAQNFEAAKQSIRNLSFDDTKLSTAKGIAYTNYLTSQQVLEICRLFSFEQTKLDFAKYAFTYTTDPGNYFIVNKAFNFSSSTDELNKFIYGM